VLEGEFDIWLDGAELKSRAFPGRFESVGFPKGYE
jgi:hypothetical protein